MLLPCLGGFEAGVAGQVVLGCGLAMFWHDQTKVGNYDACIRIPDRLHDVLAERQRKTVDRFTAEHGYRPTGTQRAGLALFPTTHCNPGRLRLRPGAPRRPLRLLPGGRPARGRPRAVGSRPGRRQRLRPGLLPAHRPTHPPWRPRPTAGPARRPGQDPYRPGGKRWTNDGLGGQLGAVKVAEDGVEFVVTTDGQDWRVAWHPPPDAPAGVGHGSAGVCVGGVGTWS